MNQFEAALDGVARQAEARIKCEEGDFFNDEGILLCGKCRTPKQVKIEILGVPKTVMCLCKCEQDKRDAEEREWKEKQEAMKLANRREICFSDHRLRGWTFDKDDGKNEKLTMLAKNYVENFKQFRQEGRGLLLFGGVGSGKTFISACIANALIDMGYPCMMTNFSRLTNTLNGMFEGRQEYLDSLNEFSLLVIDDLAAERNTEYMDEIVYSVTDGRCRAGKPLIVTTNLTKEELSRPSDVRKQRIYSRLFEMCYPFCVEGVDRREQKLEASYAEMEKLFDWR